MGLKVSRKVGETVQVGSVLITVKSMAYNRVILEIDAPREIPIQYVNRKSKQAMSGPNKGKRHGFQNLAHCSHDLP